MARKDYVYNCGNIGAIGEVLVTLDLMRKGYEVFRAISPSASVDLIVIKGGAVQRVEVTKGNRKGSPKKLKYPPHKAVNFDVLAVWEDNGEITYISNV